MVRKDGGKTVTGNVIELITCVAFCYLPFVALNCGVDVLLQQLLWFQLMNAESFQQLSDLLAFQRLQTAQQGWVNNADVLVQGRNCSWKKITHTTTFAATKIYSLLLL